MSLRTYQERLSGLHEDWKISELIEITKFNNGGILIKHDNKEYVITIHELGLKDK